MAEAPHVQRCHRPKIPPKDPPTGVEQCPAGSGRRQSTSRRPRKRVTNRPASPRRPRAGTRRSYRATRSVKPSCGSCASEGDEVQHFERGLFGREVPAGAHAAEAGVEALDGAGRVDALSRSTGATGRARTLLTPTPIPRSSQGRARASVRGGHGAGLSAAPTRATIHLTSRRWLATR